jgi:general secretion pathway protein G
MRPLSASLPSRTARGSIGVAILLTSPCALSAASTVKEAVLRENLYQMRSAISQYYADKGRYPESLETLVEAKYLRGVPLDPVTDSGATWVAVAPLDPEKTGIYDVRSGAPGKAADGTEYQQW